MAAFDDALAALLEDEGGKVDNPKDPGGRTNRGVTQRTFDAWQDAHKVPRRDVWTITPAEVAAIYRNAYFAPVRFDDLPLGVGYCVADESANSGPHQAALDLQRALGITADGAIGALTIAAAVKADRAELIGRLCDARLGFMRRLKAWATFGRGWSNRVAKVRARALAMASKPVGKIDMGQSKPLETTRNGVASAPTTSIPVSLPNCAISQVPPCSRLDCPLRATAAAPKPAANPVHEVLR